MQRKATKQSRAKNALEMGFQGWLKEHRCSWCGNDGPSIVDHVRGGAFKHNKVQIGEAFCTSNCLACDTEKTYHGKKLGNHAQKCIELWNEYEVETGKVLPEDIRLSIIDYNK